MHVMQETSPVGLRASKKQATSRALSSAARRLALERGLDAVTVDMVCAQAGVSTRTFFNYFDSKEDAIVGSPMPVGTEPARSTFVAGGPSGDLLPDVLALLDPTSVLKSEQRDDIRVALALSQSEPRVLALQLARGADMEFELAGLIAARQGLASPDFVCTATAAFAQTMLRCALFEWLRGDTDEDPGRYLDQAQSALLALARASPSGSWTGRRR